jgi:RNase P/RNase MRP subunit POP5
VQALAHNPLLLSVLAMVHQRGVGLPQRRAELYDECTDMLLGYWDQTKSGEAARELATYGALTRSEKRALLEPIALWFHERGAQGMEATREELEQEIACQFTDIFGDDKETACRRATLFLRVIDERAGLQVERETGRYAFAHLTFQEYLAARAIADRDDDIAYTVQHLHDPWWREVLLLEVGHLGDVRQFRRARRLTSDLIRAIRHAGSWLEEVLKRDLFFAVRCLCDTSKLSVDEDLRTSLVDELIALWHTTPYTSQREEIVALFAYAMPTVDGERILEELFRCLDDRNLRQEVVKTFGALGAAAATSATLKRLVAFTTDANSEVRGAAARALGRLGTAAAMPAVLENLVALTTDANSSVRWAAAGALGELGTAAIGLVESLVQFWQARLASFERQFVGDWYGRVRDIAYKQLQQLAAQRAVRRAGLINRYEQGTAPGCATQVAILQQDACNLLVGRTACSWGWKQCSSSDVMGK